MGHDPSEREGGDPPTDGPPPGQSPGRHASPTAGRGAARGGYSSPLRRSRRIATQPIGICSQ